MEKDSHKSDSLIRVIRDILDLTTFKEKRKIAFLFLLGILSSVLEVLSVGIVLPYAYILLDVERASQFPVLREFYNLPMVSSRTDFLLVTSVAFMAVYLLKSAYVVFFSCVRIRIMTALQTKYSMRLYEYYMTRPYEYYFANNASILQRRVSNLVGALLSGVLLGMLTLMDYILISLLLIGVLLLTGIPMALLFAVIILALFMVLYRSTQRYLAKVARNYNAVTQKLHRVTLEHLRSIKDLRILDRSGDSAMMVRGQLLESNSLLVHKRLVESIPNQVLECGVVAVLLIIITLSSTRMDSVEDLMANLSICGAAALKLKNSLVWVIASANAIQSTQGYYEEIYDDLKASAQTGRPAERPSGRLDLTESICLKDITYCYPGVQTPVLRDLNACFKVGEMIGIMGPSGEGKSTLADLLLGLLRPEKGAVEIDGRNLDEITVDWQGIIGYVPQDIFLQDATIMENVALGVPYDSIDRERVQQVLEAAQLGEFVQQLPSGLESKVGDQGILLSGGQKQRIGIARALYRNPEVLIFDEATSSLDAQTERMFIDTINAMRKDYTMIMIAHRKESLRYCDRVYRLEGGQMYEMENPLVAEE